MIGFGSRKLDFHGQSLMLCAQINAAIDSGDFSEFVAKLEALSNSIRYAEESAFLNEMLNKVCDRIEETYITSGILLKEEMTGVLTTAMYIFNTTLRYEKSIAVFVERGWNDPNNHSYYRRTFAEARLGCVQTVASVDCGIQFFTSSEILGTLGKVSYEKVVQPLVDVMNDSGAKYSGEITKIYLLSMNGDYFDRFGAVQAMSIIENVSNEWVGIFVVIFDPTPTTLQLLEKLKMFGVEIHAVFFGMPVFQQHLDRNTYLASIRFCLVNWMLEKFNVTIIVTDADQIFGENLDLITEHSVADSFDISIFDHSLTAPYVSLYAKYGASYVEFYPNRRTYKYAKILSNFLAANLLLRSCWTLDQFALLYCKAIFPDLRVNLISNSNISCLGRRQLAIWNQSGSTKFEDNAFTRKAAAMLHRLNEPT